MDPERQGGSKMRQKDNQMGEEKEQTRKRPKENVEMHLYLLEMERR